jgi:hypothetical protein
VNTLILFLDGERDWSPERWVVQRGGKKGAHGQMVVEMPEAWLSLLRHDDVLNDYDEEERQAVLRLLDDPIPYLVEWRGDQMVEELLAAIPPGKGAVVDNDHGLICLLSRLQGLPLWSWLRAKELG